MVDGGKPIKEALQEILDYFGDAVIIDHNAAFDIGFLNEALKKNGLPEIKIQSSIPYLGLDICFQSKDLIPWKL